MKVLLIVPIIAFAFYAFAEPEYVYASPTGESGNTVSGFVYKEDGSPLQGASIIVQGTTNGAVSGGNGEFKLSDVSLEAKIAFSFVGFATRVIEADFNNPIKLTLYKGKTNLDNVVVVGYGKTPDDIIEVVGQGKMPDDIVVIDWQNIDAQTAGLMAVKDFNLSEDKPVLYIVDGKEVRKSEIEKINPEDIESIEVLKDQYSKEQYGDKAANGVLIINTKKEAPQKTNSKQIDGETFFIVEEMPEFKGGQDALMGYLASELRYPAIAIKNGIQGRVLVEFIVKATGEISDVALLKGVDPSLDKEALRIVQSMPPWNPARQRNIPVDVIYTLPIEFVLD